MSQFDFGTIDPNSKSGPQLALDLNNFRDALNSLHKGSVRPSYAQAGMLWVKEVSSTQWDLTWYDGDTDFTLRSINPTTNTLIDIPQSQIAGLSTSFSNLANTYVQKDSGTGAATIPSGTTAQRPASPVPGMLRYNSSLGRFERRSATAWLDYGQMDGPLNEAAVQTLDASAITNIHLYNNTLSIAGTAAITSLGTGGASGIVRRLVFTTALQITHNATSLILPGGANITTAAGDIAEFVCLGSGNWRCISYQRSAYQPIGKNQCTAWVNFNGTGTVTTRDSFNVLSITDRGVGRYTINFETAMTNANYSMVGVSGVYGVGANRTLITPFSVDPTSSPEAPLVGSFKIAIGEVGSGTAADVSQISLQVFGGK